MAICNLVLLFSYNGALTPVATFASFQNQMLTTNINLVFTNLEMEQFQLLNMLEQLHHIDQRPSN